MIFFYGHHFLMKKTKKTDKMVKNNTYYLTIFIKFIEIKK